MHHPHFYSELLVEMLSKVLCRIHTAMLTACAAKTEHQVGEAALHIASHMSVCQLIHAVEECQYLTVVLQESDYRFIEPCQFLVWLITTGVMGAATVKHITTAVA